MQDVDPSANGFHGAPKKLIDLLRYHEHRAQSIRTVLMMLEETAQASVTKRQSSTLEQALVMERERRGRKPGSRKPGFKRKSGGWSAQKTARRTESAALLDKFDVTEPRKVGGKGLGSLVWRGYLKKLRDGYVRTSKVYEIG